MSEIHERLFNLSSELLCTATSTGFLVECNTAFSATLGWSREELRSVPFVEYVHPEDREATIAATVRLASGVDVVTFSNRYRCKDGSYRRLLWRAQAPRSASDFIYAAARDVTTQRPIEIGDPLGPFMSLFAEIGEPAALFSTNGDLLYLNSAGRRLIGFFSAESVVPRVDEVMTTEDAERLVETWIPATIVSGSWTGEVVLRQSGGSQVAVSLTLAAVRDRSGQVVAAAAIAHDPNAVSRVEAEVQRRLIQQEMVSVATSTPIIQVWDDIITMPVVGLVDSVRSADMKTTLLEVVSRTGARFAIIDLTGVDTVDTATADHLLKVIRAVHLLGARCVITGIQPAVAQIIVGLGLDLHGVITLRSLREGLRFCLRRLGFKIQRELPKALELTADASQGQ